MSLYRDQELFDALRELDIIEIKDLKSAYESSKNTNSSLVDHLVKHDLITDVNLGKVVADLVNYPFINLSETAIEDEVLRIIPEVYAKKRRVVAYAREGDTLLLAMENPADTKAAGFVSKKTGMPVKVFYTTKRQLDDALNLYNKDISDVFDKIIKESVEEAEGASEPEPSIIKIVDTIIDYAYKNKSSDIHVEPENEKSLIRFRIDGILHDIVSLPFKLHEQVVTRVKVMAKLRTDEHQAAQDGKISTKVGDDELDIRVSIVPITDGEKIVMRLLSDRSRQFSLEELGFSEKDLEKVKTAYNKPHGMILATGPTGSGKTTTLYSILKLLNRRDVNIMTIEDPVEYDIEGVNQIQVNPQTNLTFAAGLKSIVRQDPDIILVGEVRDEETADISINAAMTGHLVLTTLHTNDAATSIPRLMDLKVEPFLIASTVNVIIAQRLVRKICSKCRVSVELSEDKQYLTKLVSQLTIELVKKSLGDPQNIRVYKGKGCPVCHETGYVGRVGIFETLLVDDELREAIVSKSDASVVKKLAIKGGMSTMLEDGLEKVKEGITTIDEVLRVTKE